MLLEIMIIYRIINNFDYLRISIIIYILYNNGISHIFWL
jgi:hypothetical protein